MNTLTVDKQVMERFQRLAKAKRMAHAYLFVGPSGSGKQTTALTIAQLVNCEKDAAPCGACPSCMKIATGNHPDVYLLGDDVEASIKIDDVRQMLGRVALKPFEARLKVFILLHADLMTTEASNALLKTLEEPASNTLIILTTHAPQNCLDTIKSRCHLVNFFVAHDSLMADADRILNVFLIRGTGEEFVKQLSADKQVTAAAMQVLFTFVRDAALYRQGIHEKHLIFKSRLKDIQEMSNRGMDDLSALTAQIVRTKQLANENLNVKMALSLVRQRLWGN